MNKRLASLAVFLTTLASMMFAGSAAATIIVSSEGETPSLTATSTNSKLDGAFAAVECAHSEAKASVESHGEGINASGAISSLTFSGCNFETTVEAAGSLSINGSTKGVSFTGTKISIKTSVGTCVFTTNSTSVGALTDSGETSGNAVLDLNSSKIPRTGGSFLCGSSGTWTGSYTLTAPEEFFVGTQAGMTVEPDPVEFPGKDNIQEVEIKNTGTVPLKGIGVTLIGSGKFKLSKLCDGVKKVIGVGETCTENIECMTIKSIDDFVVTVTNPVWLGGTKLKCN